MKKNNLPKTKKEIKEILSDLEKAHELFFDRNVLEVVYCVDCRKIILFFKQEIKMSEEKYFHMRHFHISTDCEHDGIHEWIRCLKWILGEKVD